MAFITTPLPHPLQKRNLHRHITPLATVTPELPEPGKDPFERTYDTVRTTINELFNKVYTPLPTLIPPLTRPFANSKSPNFILHPTSEPKAVIHFLGGAFFGAVPHILYYTFLNKLAALGYVVVATPYELSFEYLPVTEAICAAWEAVESDLAATYGPLPVIGVGHSAGSLFHTLSSCLFEDLSPRAGLVLISFNNRVADDAIPGYEATVAPFSKLLNTARGLVPSEVSQFLDTLPDEIEDAVTGPLAPEKFVAEVVPTVKEARRFVEQIPGLIEEMGGEGMKQFYPSPEDVEKAVRSIYPVEQTLVVKFGGDSLDDSNVLADAIRRRGNNVSFVELKGSHVTPLAQEPEIGGVGGLLAEFVAGMAVGELEQLVKVVDEWIESGIANDRL